LELQQILWIVVCVAIAAFAQSLAGFGFSLLSVTMMVLFLSPRDAVVVSVLVASVSTTTQAVADRRFTEWKTVRRLSLMSYAGMPFGLFVFNVVSERNLRFGLGAVVIVATVLIVRNFQIPENARRYARNISHLLREESGLHRVWDPLQGSHHAEAWSLLWEERAWDVFQTYRARGGWQAACEHGFTGEQLRASRMDLSRSSQFLPADSALPPDASVGVEVQERAPWFLADTLLHSRDTPVPR
jgi:hypothetical protein